MTANQIAYMDLQERIRHNKVVESDSIRQTDIKQGELDRHRNYDVMYFGMTDKDRASRENIALKDRMSREALGIAQMHVQQSEGAKDRSSREGIAHYDRESRETIADQDRLQRYYATDRSYESSIYGANASAAAHRYAADASAAAARYSADQNYFSSMYRTAKDYDVRNKTYEAQKGLWYNQAAAAYSQIGLNASHALNYQANTAKAYSDMARAWLPWE